MFKTHKYFYKAIETEEDITIRLKWITDIGEMKKYI